MTKNEIIQRALAELEDIGQIRYADDEVQAAFDDGYEYVAMVTGCVERITTVTAPIDVVYLDINSLIPTILAPFAIWNNRTNRWIESEAPNVMFAYNPTHGRQSRELREWSVMGDRWIVWDCAPVAATSITIYHTAVPEAIGMSSTPEIPTDFHDILVDYVVADACIGDLKINRSNNLMSRVEKRVMDLKIRLDKRTTPERIEYLQCLSTTDIYKP